MTKVGSQVAIIALGSFYQIGEAVVKLLKDKGINATLINPLFISGIDGETLDNLKDHHELVITLEDGIINGGFGAKIAQYYSLSPIKVMNKAFSMNIPSRYIPDDLMRKNRLLPVQIVEDIIGIVGGRDE